MIQWLLNIHTVTKAAKGEYVDLCNFQVILLPLILDTVPDLKGATTASAPANHHPKNQLEDDPDNYPKNEQSYSNSCHGSTWQAKPGCDVGCIVAAAATCLVGLWTVPLALSCITVIHWAVARLRRDVGVVCALGTTHVGPSSKHEKWWSDRDIWVDLDLERELVWANSVVTSDEVYCLLGGDVSRWINLCEASQVGDLESDGKMSPILTNYLQRSVWLWLCVCVGGTIYKSVLSSKYEICA